MNWNDDANEVQKFVNFLVFYLRLVDIWAQPKKGILNENKIANT